MNDVMPTQTNKRTNAKFNKSRFRLIPAESAKKVASSTAHVPLHVSPILLSRKDFSLLVYVISLLACGSIYHGHERFKGQSRGKQCSFMQGRIRVAWGPRHSSVVAGVEEVAGIAVEAVALNDFLTRKLGKCSNSSGRLSSRSVGYAF